MPRIHSTDYLLDNWDTQETWLDFVSEGKHFSIEVNPVELMKNLIENNTEGDYQVIAPRLLAILSQLIDEQATHKKGV